MITNLKQEKISRLIPKYVAERYLVIFGIVLSLLCTVVVTPAAEDPNFTFGVGRIPADVTVSLPTAATASNGTVVTIPVTTTDLTGKGVISYNFDFRYDPAVLQLTATPVQTAGTISSNCSIASNSPAMGRLLVGCDVTNDLSGAGTLINLQFTVIGAANTPTGTSALSFQSFVFNGGTPTVMTLPGTFRVMGTTAASVGVGGRVMNVQGAGISRVIVSITDSNGVVRTTTTDENGFYHFDAVQAGETYILSAKGKRYSFSQAVQVQNINEETDQINFTAVSEKRSRTF